MSSLLILASCQTALPAGKTPPPPSAKKNTAKADAKKNTPAELATRAVPQTGQKITLTGRISLIAQPGAPLLSEQGGSLLSDQAGSLLSNNGSTLISNNGGGIISNNGASLIGKTKFYGLRQEATAPLGVYGLTDAIIMLYDASGKQLVNDKGQPLTATSGPDANYTLSAVLPPGNLVAKIKLWNGGELQALVTPEGRNSFTLEINTTTTLGAAYVLNKFVSGQQAILDKLPASENARLTQELDVIRAYAKAAFKHDDTLLNTVTDGLRTREPKVDRVIEDVKALLLGQAALGRGLQATEVPLAGPVHLTWLREGRLAIGEAMVGRIRALNPDGTLEMLLDKTHGRVKNNVPTMTSLAEGPGGELYAVAQKAHRVYRVALSGTAEAFLGSGTIGRTPPGDPAAMNCTPYSLAVGPDGTLWVGEEALKSFLNPRLLAVRPDRTVEAFALPSEATGSVIALATHPDGTLVLLLQTEEAGSLWRFQAGQFTQVAPNVTPQRGSGLCFTPDGTLYLSEGKNRRLLTLGANGLEEAHRFTTGPQMPGAVTAGPDGNLYVSDINTNVVWQGKLGGDWKPVAGTQAVFQQGETQAFAINNPVSVTVDDQNRIYISEKGGNSIKRFDGRNLEVVVGGEPTTAENLGDGGPATQARLKRPAGIAWHQGQLYVLDEGHRRLRRIDANGTIQSLAVDGATAATWQLVLDATGQPHWPRPNGGVVVRLNLAGQIENLVGIEQSGGFDEQLPGLLSGTAVSDPAQLSLGLATSIAISPAGEIHFGDAIGCRIYKLQGPTGGPYTVEVVAGISLLDILAQKARGQAFSADEGGDAKKAMLSVPLGLAFDNAGNLYVTEGGDRNLEAMAPLRWQEVPIDPDLLPGRPPRVRKITPAGIITTVAGPGSKFFPQADGEDALYVPAGITITPDGRLVFTDIGANLVRILPAGSF
ncbi:MAG: hypothetical protein VKN33_01115 [Candidatus Sericytochromatia bacterium]|nr:hypothetical protein [Candidatus Sericytochromatia bacterium]